MRSPRRERRGIPLRAVVPNAVTALALCSGLFGMRYGIAGEWDKAVYAVVLAAVLDGLDGRIARLLNGATRFGAELDSLSDVTAFGVAPAIIVYQFVLRGLGPAEAKHWVGYGWLFALAHAVCCALRLARFNASIDVNDQPHKSAGFLTGVPAPAGAGLLFLPIFLWLWTDEPVFRAPYVIAPWMALVAFLMVSNLATFSWGSVRLRSHVRLWALAVIVLIGGALIQLPWPTLSIATSIYLILIPFSITSYAKVRRQRAASALQIPEAPSAAALPPL